MRITIIGNCGAGKSTLSKRISKKLKIHHIHLDRFWFEAGGHTLSKNDNEKRDKVRGYIRMRVEEFMKEDSWVSDGWYPRVQTIITERATHIVFLDIPLWRRLVNHVWRALFTKRHHELSRLKDLGFVFKMIHRTLTNDPKMRKFSQENSSKLIHLRSHKEANLFLERLG
ncbi:MAG: hypothetical protein COU06_00680 [Candidatus Harrisonbacteria bacterium CG10_big_fil_rev_8_21_14_0_10_38_8]|uniref:Adenylate kinase n=1 Tax=Candidatus Harrisonbacteria bacterium CG10_big_fil_rev_8_21_14_0_10_38_8 TaxID=1974582 RepID=A0A2M6WKN5_9BACT|nr:MAG: hypothetical protein COU06_00680 [Candidatus Harrisonbacteria bacterium CG10_big_fil_rev_8_21_14_0_10_38_8]